MGTGTSVTTTPHTHPEGLAVVEDDAPRAATLPSVKSLDAPEEEHDPPCPVQETIRLVGRKWHLILLWELSQHPAGFNELKQRANGISAKMLSQSLNELEQERLVVRDIITERPLRVSYRLTGKAEELTGVFDILSAWGQRHVAPMPSPQE